MNAPTGAVDADTLRRTVRESWATALGHADFTDDDGFFLVGGTSITAIRVISLLSGAVGARLRTRMMFDHQTVAELTAAIAERLTASPPDQG